MRNLARLTSRVRERCGSLIAPGYRTSPARARQAIQQCDGALEAGDLRAAMRAARRALIFDPGWHAAHHALARVLERSGRAEEALSAWRGTVHQRTVLDLFGEQDVLHPPIEALEFDTIPLHPAGRSRLPALGGASRTSPTLPDPTWIVSKGSRVDRVPSGMLWHDATNTLLMDAKGGVLSDHSHRSATLARHLLVGRKPLFHAGRLILLGSPGCGNYYHWLIDMLPRLALVKAAGIDVGPTDRLVVSARGGRFQRESLEMLGFDGSQLVFTNDASLWMQADEIIAPLLRNGMGLAMGKETPAGLRTLYDDVISKLPAGERRRIFVGRDPSSSQGRGLINQTALDELLRAHDIETVYPERLSMRAQMELFASSSLIIAPHGAGLANLVFAPSHCCVIELAARHYQPCYRAICAHRGQPYTLLQHDVTATQDPLTHAREHKQRQTAQLTVDIEALDAALVSLGQPVSSAGDRGFRRCA